MLLVTKSWLWSALRDLHAELRALSGKTRKKSERLGFEPRVRDYRTTVFKTASLSRSDISPFSYDILSINILSSVTHGFTETSHDFFLRPAQWVAPRLLAYALVVRQADGNWIGGRIVETESYTQDDPCSHSFRGKTKRNFAMFMRGGTIYVYRIYGIHFCINIVTGKEGDGAAVLVRAIEPLWGISTMIKHRNRTDHRLLCSGPGKLCQALQIDLSFNGSGSTSTSGDVSGDVSGSTSGDVSGSTSGDSVRLLRYTRYNSAQIEQSQRIGVREQDQTLQRFFLRENLFVSRR